jgi:hypothetical protein
MYKMVSIFPLQVRNKPHVRIYKNAFILELGLVIKHLSSYLLVHFPDFCKTLLKSSKCCANPRNVSTEEETGITLCCLQKDFDKVERFRC